jgi:hypothetical protein
MKTILLLIAALGLVGCSEPPKEPRATPKVTFEGMTLPGSHADAKSSNFTDCRATYYNYECKLQGEATLLGIKPVSATVYLDGSNNLVEGIGPASNGDVRSLPLDQLSYRDIRIELPQDTFDDKCVKKSDGPTHEPPMECLSKPGVRAFMVKLKAAGWIESDWKSYRNFFRAGVPIEISVHPYRREVTIRPERVETVAERIQLAASKDAEERKKQAQANAVIEAMKSSKLSNRGKS